MKGLVLGTRNRQSKFSSLTAINLIGGWQPVYNKEDESIIDNYRLNVVTALKMGSKTNFRTGFVVVETSEMDAIIKMLGITEADYTQDESNGYCKLVNSENKPAPRKQSLLDGLKLGEYTFNSKPTKEKPLCQIRVFSDIFAGVENAVYESTKNGGALYIRNEAVTKKGVRCISTASGNIKPVYVENRPFWTTQLDKEGNIVSDSTIADAVEMLNKVDDETWTYDKNKFINPNELLEFYAANDITGEQLQTKVDTGVFTEIEEPEAEGFNYMEFDTKSLDSEAAVKASALEHKDTLGTISFGNTKDVAKLQAKVKEAIKKHLIASM